MTMKSLVTCVVAGSQYLLHPQKLGTIQETIFPDALIPVTLLETHEIFDGDLAATLRRFELEDDVFIAEFGNVLIEKPGSNSSTQGQKLRRAANFRLHNAAAPKQDFARLPSGPYFLHGPNLYQAWRLYEDSLGAFAFGVIAENTTLQQTFRTVSVLADSGAHKAIAVPSRLYFKAPSENKPLNGMRIAVPDAVALAGVPTILSSRAWNEVNDAPASSNADLIQQLLDLGAIIVGKSKSSQFGSGYEWVDEAAPWSSRGDGYQSPLGGASGAAMATAGYPWLETATGLDAIDGLRKPAAAQGLFTIRTTRDTISLKGSQISSSLFDTVAFVDRDVVKLHATLAAIMPTSTTSAPSRLIYPINLFNDTMMEQKDLMTKFVKALENELGIKAEKLDVSAKWASTPPLQARGLGLQEYIKDSPFRAFCYEFYHQYDNFRAAYQDKVQHLPYAEATVQYRWDIGKNISEGEYSDDVRRMSIVRNWFQENIMPLTLKEPWTALVMPFGSQHGNRDDESSEPTKPWGITEQLLPMILNVPQMIAPFGQSPYESRMGTQEYFPFSGAVLGPRGSDPALVNLVSRSFQRANWPTKVSTGRFVFSVRM
ncbi:hypothetical protein CDD81_7972 [Ophiocordyceps australis]|uniref:Amidase domain-containing protein n=1 Tax=Ophiocordyceps australis TaxID=1399860 RepID=A0A2C5XGJ2_9HYPO|nr:hypothetical protein CDD81_7972 [Ophiocordyceps australis]